MAEKIYGETDRTRGRLIYNTSYSDTQAQIKVQGVLDAKSYGYSGYRVNATISGNTVTKLGYVPSVTTSWQQAIATSEYTKTINKTHASQTISIGASYAGEYDPESMYNAGSKSGSTSVSLTIPAKTSYVISFNANGGSGAPGNQTKWYGESLTLSSTKPTRTGYSFVKWNTKSDGSGTSYNSSASYTTNANATLYAQWSVVKYTITYKGNGFTGNIPPNGEKTYGVTYTIPSNVPTLTGWDFIGWYTNNNGTGTKYMPGGSYTTNANLTLYATGKKKTYTITYNANGGSNPPAAGIKTYGVAYTIASAGNMSYSGYSFTGWNTAANGSGTSYPAGYSYTGNAALNLYAQWKLNYTVPAISGYNNAKIPRVVRCNANGVEDDEGTYAKVSFHWSTFSSNYPIQRIGFAYKNGSSWVNAITQITGTETIRSLPNSQNMNAAGTQGDIVDWVVGESSDPERGIFDTDNSYEVRIIVGDTTDVQTSRTGYSYTTISSSFFIMDFGYNGKSMGIGTVALDPIDLTAYPNGLLKIAMALQDGDGNYIDSLRHSKLIPNSSDLNDYKEPGIYYIQSNANAQTLENCPAIRAFYLIIFGNQKSGASNFGVLTQKIITFIGEEYVRYYNHWNSSPAWTDWVMIGGVDCIVERGTSGIWRYEKWRSGKAECWGKTTVTGTFTTARNSVYAIDTLDTTSANFPSSLFNTTPAFCNVTGQNASTWNFPVGFVYSLSSSSVSFFPVMTGKIQTSATFTYYIHAIGTWK